MKFLSLFVALLSLVKTKAQDTKESLGEWKVVGTTGASAMHMVVTAPNRVVILDKAELNPTAKIPGKNKTGWTTEYDLDTNTFRVLNLETNTFCSAGAFLANGTLIETAGGQENVRAKDGYSKIRMFTGCTDESCDWLELERDMDSARWYNTMVTLPDGRTITIGGSTTALAINTAEKNNPTYEFFPEVGQKKFDFLEETLPFNLYPMVHVLPNRPNTLFILANNRSILFDYTTGQITKQLPDIDHPRTYPLTAASVLLPLTYKNNYEPEILVCGGQSKMKPKLPALDSCGRLKLGDVDSKDPKWEMEDFGGLPRVMPDSVILPDGTILFLNGAGVGYAGYVKRNEHWVADDPVKTPVLYDPDMPKGERWTRLAPSEIARMYHSVATLLADGTVFVAGSNPNNDYNSTIKYPTEYRAERFTPPYLLTNKPRAKITKFNESTEINAHPIPLAYAKNITISLSFNSTVINPTFRASLIHFGFVTHSQHMSQRYVELRVSDAKPSESEPGRDWQVTIATHEIHEAVELGADTHEWEVKFEHEEFEIKGDEYQQLTLEGGQSRNWQITVETPPNPNVLPPGPSYLFVLADGMPSEKAVWVLLGQDN